MNIRVKYIRVSLFVFVLLNVASFAIYSIAIENAPSTKSIFLDSDQDGLGDEEEKAYATDPHNTDSDNDGYSDGTEVKSGYDPLKPAPGDRIIEGDNSALRADENQTDKKDSDAEKSDSVSGVLGVSSQSLDDNNMTQKISDDLAVLMNDAQEDNQPISMDDLDALVEKSLSQSFTAEDLPEIDISELKIKKQDYSKLSDTEKLAKEKQDALDYLTAASYIMINNAPQKITDEKDLNSLMQNMVSQFSAFSTNLADFSFYDSIAESSDKSFKELIKIEVPEKYVALHTKGLGILKQSVQLKNEVKPNPDDPISTMVQMSKIQNLLTITMDFSEEISAEFEKLGIDDIPIKL